LIQSNFYLPGLNDWIFSLKSDYLYNMEIKTCSKCKVDLPLSEFQTYYHRPKKKHFTRGHCTKCFYSTRKKNKLIQSVTKEIIVQPVVLELEPEVFKVKDIKQKTCVTCLVVKTVDDFYKNRLVCKKCCTDMEKKSYQDKTYQRLNDNGGSLRVPIKPGNFHDEYQRHYTHEILLSMGWKLNEENGMWWKEGIKNKDGIFTDVRKPLPTKHNLKYFTLEEKLEKIIIIIEQRRKGKTYVEIGKIIDVSAPTACKWLKQYEKK